MMPSLSFGRDTESHDKTNRSWRRLGAVLPSRPRGSAPELHDPSKDLYDRGRDRGFSGTKAKLDVLSALNPQNISGSADSNTPQLAMKPPSTTGEVRSTLGSSSLELASRSAMPGIPSHYSSKTSDERAQPSSPPNAFVFDLSRNPSRGSEGNWRDRGPKLTLYQSSSSEPSLSHIDHLTPPPLARRRQVGGQRHPFVSEERLYKKPPPKTSTPTSKPANPTFQNFLPTTSSQTSIFDPSRNLEPIIESIMSPSDHLSGFYLSNEMRSMQLSEAAIPSGIAEQDVEGKDFSMRKSFASQSTGEEHVCSICDRGPSQTPSLSDATRSSIGLHVIDDVSRSSSDFSSHRTDTTSISEQSQASGETTASSPRRRKRGRRQAGGQRHPIIIPRSTARPLVEPPSIDPTPPSKSTKNPKLWVPGGGRHPSHFPSAAEIAQRRPSQRPNLSPAEREQQIRALCSTALIFRKPRPPFDSNSLRSAKRSRAAFPFSRPSINLSLGAEDLGMPISPPSSSIPPKFPPLNAAVGNYRTHQDEAEHDGPSSSNSRGPRIILWTPQRGIQGRDA